MRQLRRKSLKVRGTVIGGKLPLVCLPLLEKEKTDLLGQAAEVVAMQPDMLEWRVDGYGKVEDVGECLAVLSELRVIIGNLPLIFTCRSHLEEGLATLSQSKRFALIESAMHSGNVDIVDVEICNEGAFLAAVIETARNAGVKIILSHHNFTTTPDESFLVDKLIEGQELGADISKLAVMPACYGDVLTLLSATNKASSESVNIPIVTMAMGEVGKITRLAGGLFGSSITFALGAESSAPGQVPIAEMRAGMAIIY